MLLIKGNNAFNYATFPLIYQLTFGGKPNNGRHQIKNPEGVYESLITCLKGNWRCYHGEWCPEDPAFWQQRDHLIIAVICGFLSVFTAGLRLDAI